METELLHQRENNESSENHLKDNGAKFSRHCVEVLRLLYQGKKLNARQLETEYGYDGRRLRDVYANRKDIKKQWVRNKENKTEYMEYWMELIPYPTKSAAIEKAGKLISMMKSIPGDLKQTSLFP